MDYNPTPFNEGYLLEESGHKIYYAELGNQKGEAIVVCHGGPGSSSRIKRTNIYDLTKFHVIVFDQRGCGQSLPQGKTENNTTIDLIADMERLRELLNIKSWFVAGGSWGSTLALTYAESHPGKVKGLLLSSIFLGRNQDVDWSFTKSGGIDKIFTDLWENRIIFLKKFEANPANAAKILLKKIMNSSNEIVNEIVAGVMNWEGNLMNSQSDLTFTNPEDVKIENINAVKIFLHYEANHSFLAENQLLQNISNIKNIPTVIVHGRYDLLCTLDQMWELNKALANSECVILPSSNHKLTADGELGRKYAFRYFLTKNSNHL